jgi:hypothetical protein
MQMQIVANKSLFIPKSFQSVCNVNCSKVFVIWHYKHPYHNPAPGAEQLRRKLTHTVSGAEPPKVTESIRKKRSQANLPEVIRKQLPLGASFGYNAGTFP